MFQRVFGAYCKIEKYGLSLKKIKKLKQTIALFIIYTLLIFYNDMMWCNILNYKTQKLVVKKMSSLNKRKVKRTTLRYSTNECTYNNN